MRLDYKIYEGSCKETLKQVEDNSVQVCVTSPPYFNLRDYGTGHWEGGDPNCNHKGKLLAANHNFNYADGRGSNGELRSNVCEKCGAVRIDEQIGLEETPEEFIDKLVDVFEEVKRVLKDDGTLWVNLGDSYCNSNGYERTSEEWKRGGRSGAKANDRDLAVLHNAGYKTKDLIGIPWMFAFAMRKAGWYLRQDIIWCLSGNTEIYAKNSQGIKKLLIKDIVSESLRDLELWDGMKWVKVNGFHPSTLYNSKIEIELASGDKISCTDGHRWVLSDNSIKTASQLVVGDKLKKVGALPEPTECTSITNEQAISIAFWLTRGRGTPSKCYIPMENINNEQKFILDSLKGFDCQNIQNELIDNVPCITFSSKDYFDFVNKYVKGKLIHKRFLSNDFWNLSNDSIKTFLYAFLRCLGSQQSLNGTIMSNTFDIPKNSGLIKDLRTIASRLSFTLKTIESNDSVHCILNTTKTLYDEIVAIRGSSDLHFYDVSVDSNDSLFALSNGVLTHNCKTNPMPESVEDRCTKSHEYIFLFSKSPNYYFDFESIQEDAIEEVDGGIKFGGNKYGNNGEQFPNKQAGIYSGNEYFSNGKRRKRDVWQVSVSSYRDAHFATFPEKLIEPCILAGSKPGDVVLDPFNGSGTTGVVAMKNDRKYIGCELNPEYIKLTEERFNKALNGDVYLNDGDKRIRISSEDLWND